MDGSFIELIESSIKRNWDLYALENFKGTRYTYGEVAHEIAKLHLAFHEGGIRKGDKIAVCGRNSAQWGIAFLAAITYGAVAVPILHEFKPSNIHHITIHSETRLLFASHAVVDTLNPERMPNLELVVLLEDFQPIHARNQLLAEGFKRSGPLFRQAYANGLNANDIRYDRERLSDTALINYTSGTTSASKGVVLPYRSMWSNLRFALDKIGNAPANKLVAILTMAHMYGLAFEFIYPFAAGMHIHFLSKMPSPHVIAEAFSTVRPHLIVAVPLIIEKIIRNRVLPQIKRPHIQIFLRIPYINDKIRARICRKIKDAFGGQFRLLTIGGAALNHEIEAFLSSIRFPFTVGYGMTECGPGIAFDDWMTFRPGSCGKTIDRMEIRIDSPNPHRTVGEILVRGDNVMDRYYKNPELTRTTIDDDGWLHTGDLGVVDSDGYVYIKGRSKNLILGASGQNIYPEEIEDKLNVMPYISESLVIQREGKLVALVYPDYEAVRKDRLTDEDLHKQLNHNRMLINEILPNYSQIARINLMRNEFEKSTKKSIKRFLYQ